MECECLPECPFFHDRMKHMPTTAEVLKQRYCRGDSGACARCLIVKALGREAVPADLFPHEVDRAQRLIAAQPAAAAPTEHRRHQE